jgi:hypothetical protein
VDNGTLGIVEIGWDDENIINVTQDRENLWAVVNKVMNFQIE